MSVVLEKNLEGYELFFEVKIKESHQLLLTEITKKTSATDSYHKVMSVGNGKQCEKVLGQSFGPMQAMFFKGF